MSTYECQADREKEWVQVGADVPREAAYFFATRRRLPSGTTIYVRPVGTADEVRFVTRDGCAVPIDFTVDP